MELIFKNERGEEIAKLTAEEFRKGSNRYELTGYGEHGVKILTQLKGKTKAVHEIKGFFDFMKGCNYNCYCKGTLMPNLNRQEIIALMENRFFTT